MKFDMTKVTTGVKNKAGVFGFKVKAHSAEIMLFMGLGCMVGAVVSSAIAGKKQEDIAEDHLKRVEKAKETEVEVTTTNEAGEEVKTTVVKSEKEVKAAVAKEYRATAVKEAKCWGPTVVLTLLGGGLITGAHVKQARTISGLTLANAGLSEAFRRYQENNIALNGEESHQMCKNGFKVVKEQDEDGFTQEKKVMKTPDEVLKDRVSSVCYDHIYEFSHETAPTTYRNNVSSMFNLNFIDSVERGIQTIVDARGYCSVDEACRALGIERDKEQIIIDLQDGWVRGGEPVRLGHRDPINNMTMAGKGNEKIILNFNVHGNLSYLLDQQRKAEKKVFEELKVKRDAEVGA